MAVFKCKSTKYNWVAVLNYTRPSTLIADAWKKLVGRPEVDANTLALKAWVIEAQRVTRDEKTPELAQAKLDLWRYKGGSVAPISDLEGMAFNAKQIALLSKTGTELINYKLVK